MTQAPARAWPLLPLLFFMAVFFGSGIYYSLQGTEFAFYQIKAPVVAMAAIVLACVLARQALSRSVERLLAGIGHPNIILMCLVFLLAGAFASVSESIGSVDATVQFGLRIIPSDWVLPALFLIAAFIATAMGTSMGTIAATRSQGVSLKDKFRVNIWIALPAALVTVAVLVMLGGGEHQVQAEPLQPWLVLPYLLVFALALSGLNVLAVLVIGIVVAGVTGMVQGTDYGLAQVNGAVYSGFESMFEIMLLSMLIGGLSQLMTDQGGTR